MFGMNKFVGIGNVGSSRLFDDGKGGTLTAISVAIDDSYRIPEKQEVVNRTIWIESIVKGDKTGIFRKGRLVVVEGKVSAEAYIDKEGKAVANIKIKSANVNVLDKNTEPVEEDECAS